MEVAAPQSVRLSFILSNRKHATELLRTILTLTLGIMGGAILPLSWGFEETGIVWGFIIMILVSFANDFTCGLLLRQSDALGAHDYESLALAVGGRFYKHFTDFSIIILLFGSLLGSIQQFGEAGAIGVEGLSHKVPHWLMDRSGSLLMALGTIFISFPLCLHSRLQELDKAAALGTALVLWLLVVILIDSIKHGLPAIHNGQLKIAGVPSLKNISQATSIFGFAFYVQPIMMPYLMELPSGKVGIGILKWATRFVVLGISFIVYAIIGLFGAARYGDQTSDNILQNRWMGGGIGQGILNLSISLYLALSVPMLEFPIRHTIYCWFPENKKFRLLQLYLTVVILLLCLSFALLFPNNSGNVLVATGAVGVCIVSYMVPIINHFLLLFKRVKPLENAHTQDASVQVQEKDGLGSSQSMSYRMKRKDGIWNIVFEMLWEIFIPLLVVGVGLFCSIMALCTL
ncbi:uncharacterized protein LOC131069823 isoform X2 [Cryptomeria japonica]|uniref:uncharacterized protein LOC131069823 isoform X2 n=1 Tax=Cryptomeria japonica TaxID=3369 RepID=UPI0025ABB112|nr:uncharacterized protein LOC131069823 isoform X2 [Cryptomeria japonica]